MRKLKVLLTLFSITTTISLTRCDEKKNVSPDTMIECNVNGNSYFLLVQPSL